MTSFKFLSALTFAFVTLTSSVAVSTLEVDCGEVITFCTTSSPVNSASGGSR